MWEQRKYRNQTTIIYLVLASYNLLYATCVSLRTGSDEELDIDDTIKRTAQKGLLDIQMRPERRNRVKVLMLFDIGGSMDVHVDAMENSFCLQK